MQYDFIIIGGGIAGASAAYSLALHGSFALLEMEDQLGYHTTRRSAAQFTELYGNTLIRALARLSKDFLESPLDGFTQAPILTSRGAMFVATDAQRPVIDAFVAMAAEENCPVAKLDVAGA
jgi:D-arginine dehydrogenase